MDLYTIWSERNTAVRECNMAVAEKRQAMADRDIAILQRDAAFVELDNARMQRDNAIARLQLKTNSMNASSVIHNPSESGLLVSQGVKQMSMLEKQQQQQQQQRRQHIVNYSEIAFKPVEVPFSDVFAQSTNTSSKSTKAKKGKRAKETKTVSSNKASKPARETKTVSPKEVSKPARETKTVSPKKASKPVRETKTVPSAKALKPTRKISKRGTRLSNKQVPVAPHASPNVVISDKKCSLEKQVALKGGLSLNELGLDDENLPVPFCSCTGNPQSCYKWGKGGWQSACCTTTLSMYPLPQMPNKRHSRMGGRKMSGGAFTKLITRLASEGHNITAPIDLKNHWAKHGTNRYIIIR